MKNQKEVDANGMRRAWEAEKLAQLAAFDVHSVDSLLDRDGRALRQDAE